MVAYMFNYAVSVPSRRSLYSNLDADARTITYVTFPSPLGDPYIQMTKILDDMNLM